MKMNLWMEKRGDNKPEEISESYEVKSSLTRMELQIYAKSFLFDLGWCNELSGEETYYYRLDNGPLEVID